MNRIVNPALKAILRSPIHSLASGRLALITYTGRRSGRDYTIPCFYRDKGDEVTIAVGWPDRKVWWRNLTGEGRPVRLLVQGLLPEALVDERFGAAPAFGQIYDPH